jgi:hypothetical protein
MSKAVPLDGCRVDLIKRETPQEGRSMSTGDDRPDYSTVEDILRSHADRLRHVLPSVKSLQVGYPEGTEKPDLSQTIFPVLDFCKGAAIDIDSEDFRWEVIYGAGMPDKLPRIDIVITATVISQKFKDFAFHGKGVLADPENPDIGKGAWVFHYENRQTHELFIIHGNYSAG